MSPPALKTILFKLNKKETWTELPHPLLMVLRKPCTRDMKQQPTPMA